MLYFPFSFEKQFFAENKEQVKKNYNEYVHKTEQLRLDTINKDMLFEILPYDFKNAKDIHPAYFDIADGIAVKQEKNMGLLKEGENNYYFVPVFILSYYKSYFNNAIIFMNGENGEMCGRYSHYKENYNEKTYFGIGQLCGVLSVMALAGAYIINTLKIDSTLQEIISVSLLIAFFILILLMFYRIEIDSKKAKESHKFLFK